MRSSYQTEQRRVLLECLEKNRDRQLTADELIEQLGEAAPGKSTVYRLIKKLCEEGCVQRFVREGSSKSAYQLAGPACCAEHLHIKCTGCGMLLHIDRSAQDELSRLTGFVIDDTRSMLYGKCARCAEVKPK